MSKSQSFISPIAIDLGAKNTGVFSAHYPAGSSINSIEKMGRVYRLDKDSYTLLMTNRTKARHQRRGYKRKRMVKRLFRLIWCQEFGLQWDDCVQKSVSFLLNRRGFSYLTDDFRTEILDEFPKEAYLELPEMIRDEIVDDLRVNDSLTVWKRQGPSHVKNLLEVLNKKSTDLRRSFVVISRARALKTYCKSRINKTQTANDKSQLRKLPKWIIERWEADGIRGLEFPDKNPEVIDLISYLDRFPLERIKAILNSIPIEQYDSENNKLKASNWNFDPQKFDYEKEGATKFDIRTHLHHFVFALDKIHNELTSGARHRSKYFEEIEQVLKRDNHTHRYLAEFCSNIRECNYTPRNRTSLTVADLARLIGHLSNLELKPLRKYFNNVQHKNGDCWDSNRLGALFGRWILKDWRVDFAKDRDKAEGEAGDYRNLRMKWKSHRGDVVDFWLREDPHLTIPPYQDNNNRRPPRCQSLILNPEFLDRNYGCWQNWVSQIASLPEVRDYLNDYQKDLGSLKSGKNRRYFSDDELTGSLKIDAGRRTKKDLNARVLQFVFDRVKADDPLMLNEIFSQVKKIRQSQSTQEEKEIAKSQLEKSIETSSLPEELKTARNYQNDGVFRQGSFLHLVCNYYKFRQKARSGRLFIHHEFRYLKDVGYRRTGRFESRNHLLTYCNHIPRHLHSQLIVNLAALFSLSEQQFKKRTKSESDNHVLQWLSNIHGFKSNCQKAAQAQKLYRGGLKESIYSALTTPDSKLCILTNRCNDLCTQLYNELNIENGHKSSDNPAAAVFLLAQIYNIAFSDRNGKSNTCAVCNFDNARRMQFRFDSAHAQRLPAIPTRLIDGAVMKMARIIGQAIAKDKWETIEKNLRRNDTVRVPIITESNRFEFEPNLNELKDIGHKNAIGSQLISKKDRIKAAANNISPYSGKTVVDDGDLDHIIPRSHPEWGTLNDEANLIYTSQQDNREVKGDQVYTLADLHTRYKMQVFNTSDISHITKWINETIWDENKENFKFGRYLSFINLNADQQKAFRHALFLKNGNPLRKAVIDAINHRTKTLVNGTQRYFAEVLANELYKKAKAIKKHHLLTFDYFGVEAWDNSRGDGVHNLRSDLVEFHRQDLKDFSKRDGAPQTAHSHLIDAQIAFCMIADAHQGEGGLRIDLEGTGIWSRVDRRTGEVLTSSNYKVHGSELFDAIEVRPDEMKCVDLKRSPLDHEKFAHRMIHRDTLYAEHYLPILVDPKNVQIRIGFDWNNSFELNESKPNRQKLYFALKFNRKTKNLNLTKDDSFEDLVDRLGQVGIEKKGESNYLCIFLNKQMIHQYYVENFNSANGFTGNNQSNGFKFLRSKLTYRTERKKLTTLKDAKKILSNESNFKLPKSQSSLVLPVWEEWKKLVDEWERQSSVGVDNDKFLRSYFINSNKNKVPHEKIRMIFSLPVKTRQGKMLVKRKSWDESFVFQIVNDSDPSGAKRFVPVIGIGGIGNLLSGSAKSSNVFFLQNEHYHSEITDGIHLIDPTMWYAVNLSKDEHQKGIVTLEYQITDISRPMVQVQFSESQKNKNVKELLTSCEELRQLLAPRFPENKSKRNEFVQECQEKLNRGDPLEYKGNTLSNSIKLKVLESL